jgi:hypothetical protein
MMRAAGESWQYQQMRGDDGGNKALPQMSNISVMQQSTCWGTRREDKWRYGDGGQKWWRMTAVADNNDTPDWAVDCNGEGRERAVRDDRDSRVVMMAVAVEDSGGGGQQQRQTTISAEDNGMRDPAADYDGEGQEQVAREGGDSGVAMMAAAADNNGGGGRKRQWRMTTAADDKGGGWWWHARSSGGLRGGRRRAGGKQQQH